MLIITYILFADLITFESRWIEVYTFFLTLLHDFMFCCYSFSLYHNFYLFYLSINVLQLVHVWIQSLRLRLCTPCVLCGSRALFTKSANTSLSKNNFKIRTYNTIHTFKNYSVTVFTVFSFQFSVISGI